MPEGHLIHRFARSMSEMVGHVVTATSPQGRFAAAARTVTEHEVEAVDAFGKHLLIGMSGDHTVHVHLGMRGTWLRSSPVTDPPLPQVRLRLAAPHVAWDLIAPSRCELLDAEGATALTRRLGPDPLRPDRDASEALRRLAAAAGPVGAVVLDQRVIAGVGNVFRAEALHDCGLAPTQPTRDLSSADLRRLWNTIEAMMSAAVEEGRIVTVAGENRLCLSEEEARRVYKRTNCYDCGTPIEVASVGGRTSYSCPHCQPLRVIAPG
jgi:endonuclease-8